MKNRIILAIVVIVLLSLNILLFKKDEPKQSLVINKQEQIQSKKLDKDGFYTSKNDVVDYIETYKTLPKNFITKQEAKKLGWIPSEGNLWKVAPKKSIGGDKFLNLEKKLPKAEYKEADIDYEGGKRNAKRVVFSSEGLIFYTDDHYKSFKRVDKNR